MLVRNCVLRPAGTRRVDEMGQMRRIDCILPTE